MAADTPENPTAKEPRLAALPFASLDGFRLNEVIDDIGDAVCVTDSKMVFKGANQNFARLYGLRSPEVLLGKSAFEIYPDFKKSVFYEICERSIRTGETATRMGRSLNTGLDIVIRCYKSKAYEDRYVMVIHRMSEGSAKADYSSVDSLTSLPNRWKFEQDLDNMRAYGKNVVGLLLVDINHFKQVNEVLGMEMGDRCLMEVAARIKMAVTKNDHVYRQGDDRFLIMCDPADELDARRHTIAHTLSKPFTLGLEQYVPDLRMGLHVTTFEETPAQAMTRVERALSWAKEHKEPYARYSQALNTSRFDHAMAKDLREALSTGGLQLYFQPQVDLIDNRVIGAEALIRWVHPTRGFILPDQFLGYAEDSGFIREVDEYALRTAIIYQQDLIRRGIRLQMSVNLSSLSVCNPNLVGKLEGWLKAYQVPADLVAVEITETAMMRDVKTSQDVIESIKKLGVEVAIDDFGTGYSSMQYLARYPSNTLKIDRSFVSQLTTDEAARTMVKSMIGMAHGLRIMVVAEGVETQEELDLLRMFECDTVQGYFFAKPMPTPAFEAWIADRGVGEIGSTFR